MNEINRFEKRKRRTRNQLKQCALELLLEKGYVDLTIQDITDAADFARGTFYVHFKDKDEIIWAILQDSMQGLVDDTLHGLNDIPHLKRKYLIWHKVFTYAHENRELLRVLLGDKGHPRFTQSLLDFVAGVIEEGMMNGAFKPEVDMEIPVTFMAQYTTGALVRVMLWSLETDYTPDQLAKMFYEFLYQQSIPSEILTES